MKTIGSAVVIILAAIVGLFLGAAMNDGLSGSILLAVIAGFANDTRKVRQRLARAKAAAFDIFPLNPLHHTV